MLYMQYSLNEKKRLSFIDSDLLYRVAQQDFRYIVEVSFTGGGNQSNGRNPPTCHMSLTNFITQCFIEYSCHERDMNSHVSGDRQWLHR
jgi:hypothetical protein